MQETLVQTTKEHLLEILIELVLPTIVRIMQETLVLTINEHLQEILIELVLLHTRVTM